MTAANGRGTLFLGHAPGRGRVAAGGPLGVSDRRGLALLPGACLTRDGWWLQGRGPGVSFGVYMPRGPTRLGRPLLLPLSRAGLLR